MPFKKKENAYHHGNLKTEALDAALDLLAEHGESGISLRAIGARLGVSHKAFYRHFDNQSDLSMQLAAKIYDLLSVRFAAASIAGPRDIAHVYVDFAFDCPEFYDFAFGKNVIELQKHPIAQSAVKSLTRSVSNAYLRGHGDKDGMSETEVRDSVILLWAVVHGMIDLANRGILRSRGPEALKEYLMTVVDKLD